MPASYTFSDLDLNFTMHPLTGDVSMKYDGDAVKASIRNLILTNNYERLFHSEIGCQVSGLLFEFASLITATTIENAITNCITNFEPRANLISVLANVSPTQNSVTVTITFSLINTSTPLSMNVTIYRSR